jgi:3',5'-cyclic AMP phosphodiesterase CpdA
MAVEGRTLTWLHISDLHFKANKVYDRDVVLRALIQSVERLRDKGRKPDLVFVTGDIAYSGAKEEYDQATPFFNRLLEACDLQREHLFVVPGNHDVDRRRARGLQQSLLSEDESVEFFAEDHPQYHFHKFRSYADWFDEYFAGIRPPIQGARSTCYEPQLVQTVGLRVSVLLVNSALFCTGDQDYGKLWIGRRCLDDALQQLGQSAPELRIALMHHPLDWLHDEERSNIRTKLRGSVDFVLRGHLHENEAETIVGTEGSTLFIAAGASYQTRQYPNTALYVRVDYDERRASIFPIRYIDKPREFWTADPSLFPEEPNFEAVFPFQPPPPALLSGQDLAVTEEEQAVREGSISPDIITKESTLPPEMPPPSNIVQKFYLVHTSEVVRAPQKSRRGLFRIHVWLEADQTSDLDLCKRVTYQLHPTFHPNIIATESRRKNFEVWLNSYGEFQVLAFVKLKEGESFWISRFLDLPGRPPE